jgi:hypothetical protein
MRGGVEEMLWESRFLRPVLGYLDNILDECLQ